MLIFENLGVIAKKGQKYSVLFFFIKKKRNEIVFCKVVAFWGNNVGLFGLAVNYLNVIILIKYSSSIYSDDSNLISFKGVENCRVLSRFAQT